jgi:SAM-dependent methyltransferase
VYVPSDRGLRTTFDESPAVYDRVRPTCPPAVFDDLASLAGLQAGSRLVEIGCGTGQATVPLAERGYELVCVELGARLADFTRRKLAAFPNVEVVNSAFEPWDAGGARFDAVVACNSFHWIDPDVRYAKPAALLREGGALAVVSSRYVRPDGGDRFLTEVQADYEATGAGGDAPPHPDDVADRPDELTASGHFHDPRARRYLFEVTFTADDYVALLGTSSGHRTLDEETRAELFTRIRSRIEARRTPEITLTLLTHLYVATRT